MSKTFEQLKPVVSALNERLEQQQADVTEQSSILSANLMGIDVQENLYPGAADWSGEWVASDAVHMLPSDETLNGYPVMESSVGWNRYFRPIPVEAGKTYTFEAWVKHSNAGAVFAYATWPNHVENVATISANSKQFANIQANTWTKLSFTFDCTASGNIGPFVLSSTGAFEFAKYILVEGNKVFSLTSAFDEKASVESVSGVGDYIRYDFSLGTSLGTYWNPTVDKNVSVGTKVKVIFNAYSGEYLSYMRVDGKKSDGTWVTNLCRINNPVHGGETEFVAAENYVTLRIQLYRSQDESNVTASVYIATDSELGITNELLGMQSRRIFHVEKDGSGDFTSIVEAINVACQYMDSVVYIGKGEWNLIDEYGSDYMNNVSSDKNTWGMVLKNRVHVIGSSQSVIKCIFTEEDYDRTHPENLPGATVYFSVFNSGMHGFTLENVTIVDSGIRYSVHDDLGGSGPTPYTNKFINCKMIHKNGMYSDCIGGGIGESCYVEIRGCYFEGDGARARLAYYHGNNNSQVTDAEAHITVCDNYFADNGRFQLTNYGPSPTVSTALVSNNSFGSEPIVDSSSNAPYVNMKMIKWNNEIRTT